ncbi:hypothetical protein M413DRAFT_72405 [Hebeloma cylindrosporum]|uniref:BTB domain-containing protein n=1 Tax=Hebeloma cylindrosporum TaxID=76867 RepID=A0A0C2YJ99_HEBCY|nr:hypothetical protein M413DRAFT_72405 [Hebeloma cylindrosporum h7]
MSILRKVIPNCPLSADIVLVSSDRHRFGTHCRNLGEFTGGFPVDIAPVNGEDVPMPGLDSKALALFLQYVHHHRQPDLSGVCFESLSQLAEAVEKYDVYSATEICKVHMRSHVENHCVEVFQYASKHGYRKLMDDAAKIAVQKKYLNSRIAGVCIRPDLQSAWVRTFPLGHYEPRADLRLFSMQSRYTDYWLGLFSDCYDEPPPVLHPGGTPDCKFWRKFRNVVVSQVRRELTIFSTFDKIVEDAEHHLKDCRHCGICARKWTERVARQHGIGECMTPFTSFLY